MDSIAHRLDKSLFVKMLESEEVSGPGGGRGVNIISCSAEPGVEAARNFLSNIVRVKLIYTRQGKCLFRTFIVKAQLTNQTINENLFFENEICFYQEIIPRITEIYQIKVAPKRFDFPLKDCIVLEDLKQAGYVMCDSNKKLDYNHSKSALVKLAKYHAATVALHRETPELIEQNGVETVFTDDLKYANRFKPRILMRVYGVAKVLQTMEEFKHFGNILIDSGEEFWDLIVKVFKSNSKLNVLNHGDFWTNNIMFKYDGAGLISDVKFVDFQMRRYCSPAVDLLYLFWTSADSGARSRRDELFQLYRLTLNTSLSEYGCSEQLTEHMLEEEISKCRPILLLICLFLPVIFPDPDEPFDISKVEASEESMLSTDFNINPILLPFKWKTYRTTLSEICREVEAIKIFQLLQKNTK